MQDITNPRVAERTFLDVQTMCIPFTLVNSTLRDMISIYAAPHITPQSKQELLSHLVELNLPSEAIGSTNFYVFGATSYPLFLQMIAKEDCFSEGTRTYTQSAQIIYSNASQVSFGFCPTFTKADKTFWDIEHSAYAKTFSPEQMHILRIETKQTTMGKRPNVVVDYCMFIPGGVIIPKVAEVLKKQKSLH